MYNQEKKIDIFIEKQLMPLFREIKDTPTYYRLDNIYKYIIESFEKNSCVMFGMMFDRDSSYQVAQTMRFFIELVSDLYFITQNPDNLKHLDKEIMKYVNRMKKGKKPSDWREIIASTKNITLIKNGKPICDKCDGTTNRIKSAFDSRMYGFYSAYVHANIFAIYDDLERIHSGDINDIGAQRYQIIADYPKVLEKLISIIEELLKIPAGTYDLKRVIDCYDEIFERN